VVFLKLSPAGDGSLLGIQTWRNLTLARDRARLLLSCSFRRFSRVPENLFANDTFRGFVEIGVQGRLQLEEFRPKRVVHKGPRRAHYHGGVTLTLVAIRFEPVSSAKRRKEALVRCNQPRQLSMPISHA
jgi:hypothetical protein